MKRGKSRNSNRNDAEISPDTHMLMSRRGRLRPKMEQFWHNMKIIYLFFVELLTVSHSSFIIHLQSITAAIASPRPSSPGHVIIIIHNKRNAATPAIFLSPTESLGISSATQSFHNVTAISKVNAQNL